MCNKISFSTATLGLMFSIVASVNAAEPISLQRMSFEQLQKMVFVKLSDVANQSIQTTPDSFHMLSQRTDERHVTHIRMQQKYHEFPVFGGYGILHSKASAKTILTARQPVKMTGTLFQGLESELGLPNMFFIANGKKALQQFEQAYAKQSIEQAQVMPMVYIDEAHHAFWAYQVNLVVQQNNGMPTHPTAIIDAQTFKPFLQWDNIKTNRAMVKAKGYGGNPRTGAYQFGADLPLLNITRDAKAGICYLENQQTRVVDMQHQYDKPSIPMQFLCGAQVLRENTIYWTGKKGDGYDVNNGAYSPSNDALYVGSVIHDMYQQWYGLDALTRDNKPMPLIMRVHYGYRYENAFWDGQQMTFGDGDDIMYPLVSLSIGAHEISHGFTEQHADLYYIGQSGGMNEAFSDMAAMAAEFYAKGAVNWSIASEVMKENSGYEALRYMDKPSRDGQSIDTASQYQPGMDVHHSSGVYNRLFYLLAHQAGWDVRSAFDVMLKANMYYWTPYSSFNEGACGILFAAEDLGRSVEEVKLSLDEVKINYQDC